MASPGVTEMDRFLFDLRGYLVLRRALNAVEVAECKAILDELQDCGPGEWRGRLHGHSFTGSHEALPAADLWGRTTL